MPKIEQNVMWSCKHCTYDNFPASIKCTLCSRGREEDEVVNPISNYCISEEEITESDKNKSLETSDQVDVLHGRWACLSCTYLNWENSLKCVMCEAERPNDFVPQPKTIDSVAQNQAEKHDDFTVNNNEKNKSISKNKQKWTCPQCTFENWNKSKKCCLCFCLKPKLDESVILKTNSQNVLNLKKSGRQRTRPKTSGGVAAAFPPITNDDEERLIYGLSATNISAVSQIKNNLQESDWMWLSACIGVVEGEPSSVKYFLSSGGTAARKVTPDELLVLNRPGVFEVGDTLVHLALRYDRHDLLNIMLPHEVSRKAFKKMLCHISPDLATSVQRQATQGLRQRKGDWPCYFYTDLVTFTLPGDLQDLPGTVQQYALDEIVDHNAQRVLQVESVINWSVEITNELDSRVYALWNRSAGDCLLDSIFQATWGIFDRENALRNALYVSLSEGASRFFPRWKEWEEMQATNMQFTLDEDQWEQDWASVLSLASQPGASLEQTHVFAMAHIIRRPIIIYGVKFVKSYQGDTLGYARFQGVYLPLLWEKSFCWRSPIALGYTRGHFSALVAMETEQRGAVGAGAHIENSDETHVTYLPLVDHECNLLPVHFVNGAELGNEDQLLREWLDCHITNTGILVAEQQATPRLPLVSQLVDRWLDRYRKMNKELVTERRK